MMVPSAGLLPTASAATSTAGATASVVARLGTAIMTYFAMSVPANRSDITMPTLPLLRQNFAAGARLLSRSTPYMTTKAAFADAFRRSCCSTRPDAGLLDQAQGSCLLAQFVADIRVCRMVDQVCCLLAIVVSPDRRGALLGHDGSGLKRCDWFVDKRDDG